MRIAVIDDLDICRQDIKDCLTHYFCENYSGETPVIEDFSSGEDFLARFTPETFDIIFIDQYLDGISGIKTALKIRESDKFVAVIFVTTSTDHAIDSYGVRACGYLVKPYDYSDFENTMNLAGLEKIRDARYVQIGQDKILLREILWCTQDGHYVQIHTEKRGTLRYRISFGKFSVLLQPYPQFLTCYKCCIVNLDRVRCMDKGDFIMETDEKVLSSQREKRKIESLYYTYLFHRERGHNL